MGTLEKAGRNMVLFSVVATLITVALASTSVYAQVPVLEVTKTVNTSTIWHRDCEPLTPRKATVTLRLRGGGDCTTVGFPVDVMLVLDKSGSMAQTYGTPPLKNIEYAKAAAQDFVDLLRDGDRDRAGLISFGGSDKAYPEKNVYLNMALGHMDASGKALLQSAIGGLSASGLTPLGEAIYKANKQFVSGRPEVDWFQVLLSDGDPTTFIGRDPLPAAQQAADMGITIFVIGLSVSTEHKDLLEDIAAVTGGTYYDAPNPAALHAIFQEIAFRIICTAGRDILVTETVQAHFNVIGGCPNGFSVFPLTCFTNPDGSLRAQWYIDHLDVGETWSVSFDIESDSIDAFLPVDVLEQSNVAYTKFIGPPEYLGPAVDPIPQAFVTVKSCTPELDATKNDGLKGEKYPDGFYSPGDTIQYDVVIQNTGYDATGVVYCDTVDAHTKLIPASITPPGAIVAPGDLSFCIDLGTIAELATENISFLVVIEDPVPEWLTQVENQGFIASNELDDVPTDDPVTGEVDDPTVTPVVSRAIIEAWKDDAVISGHGVAPESVTPGGVIEYTVTLENIGNKAVSGLTYHDEMPAHTTYDGNLVNTCGGTVEGPNPIGGTNPIHITGIELVPNGGCTITYRVRVNNTVPAGVTEIVNQGVVQEDPVEPTDDPATIPPPPSNEDDPTRTPLEAAPGITVLKEAAVTGGGIFVIPGGTIDYTVTICNTGDQEATGLDFADGIPEHTNIVSHSTTCGGNTTVVDDTLRLQNFSLAGGNACCQVMFQVRVIDPVPVGVDTIFNQAFIRDIPPDGNGELPSNVTKTPIQAGPVITAVKTATVLGGESFVLPGGVIEYELEICNVGNRDATGLDFADGIPENTSLVPGSATTTCGVAVDEGVDDTLRLWNFDLDAKDSGDWCCTVTFQVKVDSPYTALVDTIFNQGFVRDIPDIGETPSNITRTPVKTGVDIDVDKSDGGVTLSPGDLLQYTVTIFNGGPEAAQNLTYDDETPAFTDYVSLDFNNCGERQTEDPILITGIDIPAGGSCTIRYTVKLWDEIPEDIEEILNQGFVCNIPDLGCEPSNDPGTPTDNDSTETPIQRPPLVWDPVVYKSAIDLNGGNLRPGDMIEYVVIIENPTDEDVFDLVFDDPVPEHTHGLIVVSWPPEAEDFSSSDNVHITGIDVEGGASDTVIFRVTVDIEVSVSVTSICNQGVVRDQPGTNEVFSNIVCLPLVHDTPVWDPHVEADMVAIDVNGDGLVGGDVIEYRVLLTNNGPEPVFNLLFQCPLPDYTENVTVAEIPEEAVDISLSDLVTISGIPLEVGQTADIAFTVHVVPFIPAGVNEIVCQGVVGNIPFMDDEPTDDPATPAEDDATRLILDTSLRKCDVNEDGATTLTDLFLQLRQVIRDVELTDDQFWAADFNGDDEVDIIDLMHCIQVSLYDTPKIAGAVTEISMPSEMTSQHGVLTVPLQVNSSVPLGGAWLKVRYDPEVLTPQEVRPTLLSSHMSVTQRNERQSLWVLVYSETGETIPEGKGTVVRIPFSVARGVDDLTEVRIDEAILFVPPGEAVVLQPSSSIVSVKGTVPEKYVLEQNAPNPFNPETRIVYHLPEEAHVSLEIFNILGQRVITLVDEDQPAGSRTVKWTGVDRNGVPVTSGVYFYTIRMGHYVDTKRMILAR